MSKQASLPDLEVDALFWRDLEVPFGKVRDKWDERYSNELQYDIERGRIKSRVLDLYFTLMGESDFPDNAKQVVNELHDYDENWAYNLVCVRKFASNKNTNIVKDCAREGAYSEVEGTPFHRIYRECYDSGDKIGLIALLHLFNRNRLRDIHGLSYCYPKKPRSVASGSEISDLDINSRVNEILETMSSDDFRTYDHWHSFESNGTRYVMIKRQIDDDVERQANGNIEEEPAEFVILKFVGDRLEIISKTKTIAEKARNGVNSSVDGAEFNSVDADIPREELDRVVTDLTSPDSEIAKNEDLIVTGINLEGSPLPGHPSLRMKSEEGIIRAVDTLRNQGYDLTESIDDIRAVQIDFQNRDYTLRPNEQEQEGETRWVVRYDASYLRDDEREEFEETITGLLDINVVFETS